MQKYSHSGVVPVGGALLCLIGGGIAAAVLGAVYAFAIYWIPFIYINFLATLAFGFGMGLAVTVLSKTGKIRSTLFNRFAFLVVFLLGLYVYWAASIWAHLGFQPGLRVFDPRMVQAFGQLLFENGSWGFTDNAPVKGWLLVAFWAIETLIIGGVAYLTVMADSNQPFCETCHEWTETEKAVAMFEANGSEPEWERLRGGDYTALTALPILSSSRPEYVRLDVAACPKCGDSNYMVVQRVKVTTDSDGDEKTNESALFSNVILSRDQLTLVRELVDRAAEAEAAKIAEVNELPTEN